MICRAGLIVLLLNIALPVKADVAVAARNIRPGEMIEPSDVIIVRGEEEGALNTAESVIGSEAKVALYAGRAILAAQIMPAASVERNQIIELTFTTNGLSMTTEGRALGRGFEGQRIRVMNLASKTSIFGTIQRDGSVRVSK